MIIFLCSHFHRKTLTALLASPARSAPILVRPYRWLFVRNWVPGATYIFTDHDRLAPYELAAAAQAFHSMKVAGLTVLNNPAQLLTRFELLEGLEQAGINPFGAYRATPRTRPKSFPVFIRNEADHLLFSKELIEDQETLDQRLFELQRDGVPLRHLIVVEYSASPVRTGVYRKHSVFRVGCRYLGYTPVNEASWAVKYGQRGLATHAELDEAVTEIDTNPYADLVAPAFDVGHIDYGRADFGFTGEQVSIFEINTNPAFSDPPEHPHAGYREACRRMVDQIAEAVSALDTSAPPVKIAWEKSWMRRLRPFAGLILRQP